MQSTTARAGGETGGGREGRPRKPFRRILAIAARLGLGLLVLAVALVALVHVDAVATRLVGAWAARANPYPASRLRVERTELAWPAHLRAHGISLASEGGGEGPGPEVSVGLLDVRLRLASLIRGRVEVLEAGLFDVALRIAQGADSTWDALAPFGGASEDGRASQGGPGPTFRSGPVHIERARIEATFATDEPSGPRDRLVVEELTAQIGALQLGAGGPIASVDTVRAVFLPPGSAVDRVVVEGRGRLAEDRLEVDGLTLRSGASDVDVRGVLLLPADGARSTEEVDFTVTAAPLALRDISGFARGVDPAVEVRADLRVVGNTARASLSGRAVLSDGGAVEVEGEFAPFLGPWAEAAAETGDPRVVQRFQASVERLRLETLLGDGRLGGVVDASASVDLVGPAPEALTGQLRAQVDGLTLEGQAVLPTVLSGTLDGGNADVVLEGGLGGWGRVAATLEGRPLDSRPLLTVRGRFRQEMSTEGAGPLRGWGVRDLEARFEARFEAAASADAEGRLDASSLRRLGLELRSGSYGERSLAGGRMAAAWVDGVGTVTLDQPLGEGHLTGRATLRDTWSGLAVLRAEGAVRATSLELAGLAMDSLVLRPGLDRGALTGTMAAWLGGPDGPAGSLAAEIRGRPLDEPPRLSLERLTFAGLDIEGVAGLATRLEGSGRARLEGFDARSARLDAEVELAPSEIGAMSADEGSLSLSLEDGRVDVEAEVTMPGGGLVLSGWARPFGDVLELDVADVRARGLDLAALLSDAAPATELNLDARLSASGPTWRTLRGGGLVTVQPSTVRSGEISGGSVALDLSNGVARARGAVMSGEGEVDFSTSMSLLEGAEEVRADGELDLPDLATFLDLDYDVAAAGRVRLEWSASGGLSAAAELSGRVGGTAVDTLIVQGSLARSLLELDTLRLRTDFLRADGSGALALDGPEAPPAPGPGAGSPSISLTFEAFRPVSFGELPLLGRSSLSSGTGQAEVGGAAGARTAALALDLGPWETARTAGRGARVRAAYGPREAALDLSLPSARTRDTLRVVLRAEHRAEAREGVLRQLEISSETGGDWALGSPAPYTWGDEIGIRGFDLRSDEGRALVDGTFSRVAEHDLSLRLEGAQLAAIGPLLGLEDLRLVVDADARLRGTVEDPEARGVVSLEVGPRGGPPASADAEITLSSGRLSLEARVRDPAEGVMTLVGTLPVSLPRGGGERGPADRGAAPVAGPVELAIEADAFDLAWARALVPDGNVLDLEGTLSAALSLSGTSQEPRLEGAVDVRDGLAQLTATGTRYQDVRLAAVFRGGELRVDTLRVRSGSGTADLAGVIGLRGLAPTALDLTARLDRFLAWSTPPVTAVLSGDVAIAGTVDEPRIAGRVNPEGSRINLDDVSTAGSAQAVELTEADYQMLEDYFGYSVTQEGDVPPQERLASFGLRLSVSFGQDVWVTRFPQPRVSLECSGELELDKEPGGPLRVVGTVSVLPERSYFRQFGRRFAVDEGTLTLDGDPEEYAVNARARWELPSYADPDQPEVVVNLGVEATAERTELTLSSDPPMDESEIVSYLATGQAQGIISSGDQAASANIGVATATGAVAGVLESFASDRIALDVVEIAVDPVRGTTLVAGRYVSPDVYLGFRQSVSFGEDGDRNRTQSQLTEVELEYRWLRWLTMNLQTSASELRLYLRSRHDY